MSLRKFLSLMILLCVGPLILLAIVLSVSRVLNKQTENKVEAAALAKNFAAAVDQHLHARISALHMLAESSLVDDPLRWCDLYREAQGFYRGFGSHVILADLDMRMLFNTRAPFGSKLPMLPRPKGHAAVSIVLATGKPAVGDVFYGPIAKEPLVAIAAPALREGKIAFLLLTIFETHQFQERLDRIPLPAGWSLALMDGKQETIARRTPPDLNSATDVDASERFIVTSEVSPWSAVLEIPRDIYRQPLIEAATALAILILSVTLVSVLGGMLAGRRLRKAVGSLVKPHAAGETSPGIAEIAAARRLLDESTDQRERYEKALQESEERYRSIFHHSIDAVLLTAPDGRILQANPEACRIFGRSEEEICRLGRAGIVDIKDPRLAPAMEARNRTGRFQGELNFVRRDGTSFPGEISSAVFRNRDGNLRTTMIIRDMTERKQAEQTLHDVQTLLNEVGRIARIGGWKMDLIIRKATWTRGTYDIVEIEYDRPIPGPDEHVDYYLPEYRPLIAEAMRALIEDDKPLDFEAELRTAKGNVKWCHAIGRAVRVGGKAVEIYGTFQDITELKLAQTALKESAERLNWALEGTNDGIWDVQMETGEVYLSPRGCEILGYRPDEMQAIANIWSDLVHPDDMPVTLERLNDHLEGRTAAFDVEQRLKMKSGDWKWIHARGKVVSRDLGGKPLRMTGTHADISERKRVETALQKLTAGLEERVAARTAELEVKIAEVERMNRLFVDRELKMVELKAKIKELEARRG
ncbi:MAG: PAS domain S-box protein [Thermodesulfobacteriota bacterium]